MCKLSQSFLLTRADSSTPQGPNVHVTRMESRVISHSKPHQRRRSVSNHSREDIGRLCVCVCECVCVRACVRACYCTGVPKRVGRQTPEWRLGIWMVSRMVSVVSASHPNIPQDFQSSNGREGGQTEARGPHVAP